MELLWALLIGAIAGWLAGVVMKGRGFGLLGNLIIGILGAIIGGVVLGALGLIPRGTVGSLVSAFVGAVVLLFLIGLIKKKP